MTTVITRYFDDLSRARSVERELLFAKFPRKIVRVYSEAEGLVDALTAAHVDPATAEAYEHRVAKGGAVVLVAAGYKPLSAAKTAREVMAGLGALSLGNLPEEFFFKDPPARRISVMTDHPRMMLRERDPDDNNYHMANWPIPLISRRKPYNDMLFDRHARMADWPAPLIARIKPRDSFAFPRHARMANLIFPLTIRREPSDNFIFPRHARMADWPIRLISRRKPYDGAAIGRHTRMANWPFPHLINGERGTNSLVPNGARMANFPIPLTAEIKPVDKFAFPRHSRMANMILPLISKREPYTGSIVPKHGRMANFLLPLVLKGDREAGKSGGFSLSKMLGIPTVVKR